MKRVIGIILLIISFALIGSGIYISKQQINTLKESNGNQQNIQPEEEKIEIINSDPTNRYMDYTRINKNKKYTIESLKTENFSMLNSKENKIYSYNQNKDFDFYDYYNKELSFFTKDQERRIYSSFCTLDYDYYIEDAKIEKNQNYLIIDSKENDISEIIKKYNNNICMVISTNGYDKENISILKNILNNFTNDNKSIIIEDLLSLIPVVDNYDWISSSLIKEYNEKKISAENKQYYMLVRFDEKMPEGCKPLSSIKNICEYTDKTKTMHYTRISNNKVQFIGFSTVDYKAIDSEKDFVKAFNTFFKKVN